MKRNRMVLVCVLVISFTLGLAGFSLANPEAAKSLQEDRLVGVFITTEYLDLFDFEKYLNDNMGSFGGGEIRMDGETAEYQGRLYAALKERSLKNEENGELVTTKEYVFEEVEGFPYFYYTITDEAGTYSTASGSEGISDGHVSVSETDGGVEIVLEGTIYVAPAASHVYYLNPVYQSADGRVYAMSGSGISCDGNSAEGALLTRTLDSKTTVTENGKGKTYGLSVKISVSVLYPPSRIYVLQFRSDGELIARGEYLPGALPKTIEPERDCSYIILETHKKTQEEEETVSRSLYDTKDSFLESFYCREDGVCVKKFTALNWTA